MITDDELRSVVAPFKVRSVHRPRDRSVTVTGFSQNDPLGVGGYMGIIPNMATAYFKGGGWLLVQDLQRHYRLVKKRNAT